MEFHLRQNSIFFSKMTKLKILYFPCILQVILRKFYPNAPTSKTVKIKFSCDQNLSSSDILNFLHFLTLKMGKCICSAIHLHEIDLLFIV